MKLNHFLRENLQIKILKMSQSGKMLNKMHGVEAVVQIVQKTKKVKIYLKQNGKMTMMKMMMIMEVI